MKLSIRERIYAQQVLPICGSFVALRIRNNLLERLSFTEEEFAKFNIKELFDKEGRSHFEWDGTPPAFEIKTKWRAEERNPTADELRRFDAVDETEIPFGPKALAMLVDELKKLDAAGTLPAHLLSLAEKFLGSKEDEVDPPMANGSQVPEHAATV